MLLGRFRRVVGLLVLVGAFAACASPALAAPGWLGAQNLSGLSQSVAAAATGSDAAGDVVTGWIRYDGTNYIVELATRTAGGDFHVVPLQSGTGSASNLTISVNSRGDAIAAWKRTNATPEIWSSSRSGLGDFSVPQAIASVPGQAVYDPATAINDAGAAMVVWRLGATVASTYTETIYGAYRAPGGSFNTAPISSGDTWNQSPRVVLDPSGKATVVWSYWNGGGSGSANNFARVRVRAPDGTLGTQRDLSGGAPTGYPMFATVGLDAAGNAVSVWSQWDGTKFNVTGATRSAASDTWNSLPAFGQSAGASYGNEPQVAVDPAGDAVALWRAADGTVAASGRAAGGSFGTAQTGISQPTATNPHIVLDADGRAIAVWQRGDGDGSRIEAATRPPGGAFGAVKTLSGATTADAPVLSLDGRGNALAVWPYTDGSAMRTQYAAYDASSPSIAIDAPATGTAGTPVGFTARAFDVWSPVSVSWAFDDGATASGPAASHAFGAGNHGVTATATNAVGSTATTSRAVAIATPPTPPAPTPTPKDPAKPAAGWKVHGATLTLTKLTIAKLPKGWSASLRCTGKHCPFKAKALKNKKVTRGTLDALKLLEVKQRTFHAGEVLTLRINAPGYKPKTVRWVVKTGKTPKPSA